MATTEDDARGLSYLDLADLVAAQAGRIGTLEAALGALLDVAERERAGYPVEAEAWFAARDTARAALAGAAAGEEKADA